MILRRMHPLCRVGYLFSSNARKNPKYLLGQTKLKTIEVPINFVENFQKAQRKHCSSSVFYLDSARNKPKVKVRGSFVGYNKVSNMMVGRSKKQEPIISKGKAKNTNARHTGENKNVPACNKAYVMETPKPQSMGPATRKIAVLRYKDRNHFNPKTYIQPNSMYTNIETEFNQSNAPKLAGRKIKQPENKANESTEGKVINTPNKLYNELTNKTPSVQNKKADFIEGKVNNTPNKLYNAQTNQTSPVQNKKAGIIEQSSFKVQALNPKLNSTRFLNYLTNNHRLKAKPAKKIMEKVEETVQVQNYSSKKVEKCKEPPCVDDQSDFKLHDREIIEKWISYSHNQFIRIDSLIPTAQRKERVINRKNEKLGAESGDSKIRNIVKTETRRLTNALNFKDILTPKYGHMMEKYANSKLMDSRKYHTHVPAITMTSKVLVPKSTPKKTVDLTVTDEDDGFYTCEEEDASLEEEMVNTNKPEATKKSWHSAIYDNLIGNIFPITEYKSSGSQTI